ncbi:MAG: putative RNA-binding Zn-ribbon protein involved in translation (DUF1610 family) [Verrucomicrobiales bacterium]|jgi:predicted RNA-binding Zn-ribbon protein involved in translation (DUF1610 family)
MSDTDPEDKKESPWVILNCPSCEKKIKLPKEKVGAAKFKCPLCSEKISVTLPGAEKSEDSPPPEPTSQAEESIDLMGQVNPLVDDEEEQKEGFLSRIRGNDDRPDVGKEEGEVIEKDGQQLVKRRRRVRKKKKADTNPDWESEAGENEKPDREEDYSYVVDTEIDDEGNVVEVRRRVKADQKKTTHEKFSKNMAKVFIGFSFLTAIVLIGAVVYLMKTGADREGPQIGDVKKRDVGEITMDMTRDAFAVVQQYLEAGTWAEQVQVVRNPSKVRSLMEAHYEENGFESKDGAKVMEDGAGIPLSRRELVVRPEQGDKLDTVFLAIGFPIGTVQYFALERRQIPGTDDKHKYLIDWEVSERYREISDLEFKSKRIPGSEAEFRVSLQGKVSYFPPPFNDVDWRGYKLTYPGDPDFQFFGYTRIGSDLDKRIMQLFTTTGRPTPFLKVAYPEDKVVDAAGVEIINLIQSTWFL